MTESQKIIDINLALSGAEGRQN